MTKRWPASGLAVSEFPFFEFVFARIIIAEKIMLWRVFNRKSPKNFKSYTFKPIFCV